MTPEPAPRPSGPAATLPTAPAVSFPRAREARGATDEFPGPGAYSAAHYTASSQHRGAPGVSFATSIRKPLLPGTGPSPGGDEHGTKGEG